jgi:hypothetical protein
MCTFAAENVAMEMKYIVQYVQQFLIWKGIRYTQQSLETACGDLATKRTYLVWKTKENQPSFK